MEESKVEDTSPQGEPVAIENENGLSLEAIKLLAKTDKNLKSWLDSEKDKYHTKATETYKSNGNFEKDFEKYAISKGLLPDPNAQATPEEIEQASVLEKKMEKLQSDTRRSERSIQMLEMLEKAEIIGWNTKLIEKLVANDSTDEFDMAEIVNALKEFDENSKRKHSKDIPQALNKTEPTDDMLSKSEFMDLPYKQRIALLVSDERYKNI